MKMGRSHDLGIRLGIILCIACLVMGIEFSEDFNKTVDYIIEKVDRDNIATLLKNFTSRPHVGGTPAEWENAQYVADLWKSQGMDEVHMVPYDVLLSYPKPEKPNYVRIHGSNDAEIWKSQGRSKPLHSKEEGSEDIFPDFNAYSATGNINGSVVFINFARDEDFKELEKLGVNVSGCIAIAKYGAAFRSNIVKAAQDRGAIGVLLYSDPQQYAPEGPTRVYPDTVYMPGTAAAYGTTKLGDGDPLTPFYPAVESAYRISEEEALIPKIPVMPISYNDASVILSKMGGNEVPAEWRGTLNVTYKLGPGLQEHGSYVSMEVNTYNKMTKTYNVIGVIKGKVEPDRYVLLGNHRDAWIFGALDPSSASASMLELTRVMTEYMKKTGWRPRRSLVFCSWGAEEYGFVGSVEWTEQFAKQLSERAVAYLNLDMAIEGNYTLRTKASPILYSMSREISKLVPNPDPEEVKAGRKTVFDTWAFRLPDENREGFPKFAGLGSGSDYRGFQHYLGVPSMEYRYTHSKEMFAEPLYHTIYETFYAVNDLYDKGFNFHAAVTQLWAILGSYIANVEIIPFSLDEYATYITNAQVAFISNYATLLTKKNITTDYFVNASKQFQKATEDFKMVIDKLNTSDALAVRRINDRMMMVERAFIDPLGLPGRPSFNHIVFAPSAHDTYSTTSFAGLKDTLETLTGLSESEQNQQWETFKKHLSVSTHLIMTAAKVLTDDLW